MIIINNWVMYNINLKVVHWCYCIITHLVNNYLNIILKPQVYYMYKKEHFEISDINGYKVQYGKCKTADDKIPFSRTYLNSTKATCGSLCNNDNNCSGFSWDGSICKIYNPTIGGIKDTVSPSNDWYIVNKGDGTTTSLCYIKDNRTPISLDNYEIKLNTNVSKVAPYSNSYTNFNNCKNACDIDPSCNGFRYSIYGLCTVFNPSQPSIQFPYNYAVYTGFGRLVDQPEYIYGWVGLKYKLISTINNTPINTPVRADVADSTVNTFIKSNWTAPTVNNTFNPSTDSKFTLLGNTVDYVTYNGYGTFGSNTTVEPTQLRNITGTPTVKSCYDICNNDSACSGYSYNSSSKVCILYNSLFSNIKKSDTSTLAYPPQDDFYKPVIGAYNDVNWKTYIKPRPVPVGFTKIGGGQCRTNNNKEVPYTRGPLSYSMCATMCNSDESCSGYSYSDDGTCILHDPSIPVIIPANGDASKTPLTRTSIDFQYSCYIKNTPTTTSTSTTSTTSTTTNPTTSSTTNPTTSSTTNPTTSSTTRPIITTNPTTSSTTRPIITTNPTTSSTTTRPIITTNPTTSSTTSSTITPINADTSIKIVKSAFNLITITINNEVANNIDNITYNIQKIIDPNNKYIIEKTYTELTNTILLNVNKNTSTTEQFINKEQFETSNLIIKIKYNDYISLTDPNSLNRLLDTSLDKLIEPIPNNKQSIWNKYKIFFIIAIVILILLILVGIYFYLKPKKTAKPTKITKSGTDKKTVTTK